MAKKECPISRAEFRDKAQVIKIVIADRGYVAVPKEFSTGSLGWNVNDKIQLQISGKIVTVQVGLNLTVIGSKELPQD
jgi:hypothetical protein